MELFAAQKKELRELISNATAELANRAAALEATTRAAAATQVTLGVSDVSPSDAIIDPELEEKAFERMRQATKAAAAQL